MPEPKAPKMWKLDVSDYSYPLDEPRKLSEKEEPITEVNFQVKRSLRAILFNPNQELTIDETFLNKDLVDKIEAANGTMLLNDKEADQLRRAYNSIRAPQEHELEFYRRIRDVEEVEVKEKEIN